MWNVHMDTGLQASSHKMPNIKAPGDSSLCEAKISPKSLQLQALTPVEALVNPSFGPSGDLVSPRLSPEIAQEAKTPWTPPGPR